jgi:hypothetical protein
LRSEGLIIGFRLLAQISTQRQVRVLRIPGSNRPAKVERLKRLITGVSFALLVVCSGADGSGFPKPPKSAATREELVKHFGTTIGFGPVVKWEFATGGRELIIFSYCPHSGRAACYVHAYYRTRAKQAWVLFVDRLIEPAIKLSAEISGDGVEKQSIQSLPR